MPGQWEGQASANASIQPTPICTGEGFLPPQHWQSSPRSDPMRQWELSVTGQRHPVPSVGCFSFPLHHLAFLRALVVFLGRRSPTGSSVLLV